MLDRRHACKWAGSLFARVQNVLLGLFWKRRCLLLGQLDDDGGGGNNLDLADQKGAFFFFLFLFYSSPLAARKTADLGFWSSFFLPQEVQNEP